MPIVIKDFKWNQTPTDIIVQVPFKGAQQSKLDIFISSRFVKASLEQYHFELVLFSPIEKQTSKCIRTPTHIIFELKKWEKGDWEYLEPNISKAEKLILKKQILEEAYKEVADDCEKGFNKKCQLKRLSVQKQIELDTENRDYIDSVKKEEEKKALGDLDDFKKKVAKKLSKSRTTKPPVKYYCQEPEKPPPEVPKTRNTSKLQIDFTPREFPTPCRESKLEEEHEFLTKQAAARRSVGFVSEDIRPEERNPQFIKAKGDEFLKNKNYLGAISAYSYGIKLSKDFVDFYISRSEAHMGAGNYWRAAEDCSTALELLYPICQANLYERALCTGRRGEALCNLNMKKQGINEIKYSLSLINQEYYRELLKREVVLLEEQIKKEEEKQKREKEKEKNKEQVNIQEQHGTENSDSKEIDKEQYGKDHQVNKEEEKENEERVNEGHNIQEEKNQNGKNNEANAAKII